MKKSNKFSPEVRERAVRMVQERRGEYRKVSYRGLAENEARAKAQAALVNLYIARRRLMTQGVSASVALSGT